MLHCKYIFNKIVMKFIKKYIYIYVPIIPEILYTLKKKITIQSSIFTFTGSMFIEKRKIPCIKIVIIDKRTFYNDRVELQNWKQR